MIKEITLPKIIDKRGNLTFLQSNDQIPFEIKRVYWGYDNPGGKNKDGHAFKTQSEVIIALSGSFNLLVKDGSHEINLTLNEPNKGVHLKNLLWREIHNFSTNAAFLILSDSHFKEEDYIRDYEKYLDYIK